MIQDIINTRDLLDRKNFYVQTKSCVLCDNDTREVFFDCPFSKDFWNKLNITWPVNPDIISLLIEAKNRCSIPFFKIAMMVGCWGIWNHRNKIIFEGDPRSLDSCYDFFVFSINVIRHRIKPSLKEGMQAWLDLL